MKIVVDIGHPAHVHFFKNFIWEMKSREHEILITATDKDVSLKLLDNYGFNYIALGSYGTSLIKKCINIPFMDFKMLQAVRDFKPDIFVGISAIRAAHVSKLINKPCIVFDDTEHSKWEQILYKPFADVICTPSSFKKDFGRKQVRYSGYHELAYLHPNYYKPDPSVLDELGLSENETFIIIRFVSWIAGHDIGKRGFTSETKHKLVAELGKHARVFITSEDPLPEKLERYRLTTTPDKIHDLLHYAKMYVGEGATMATEAAILGTPSVYISPFIDIIGNFIDLEQNYEIVCCFNNVNKGIEKAVELIQKSNLEASWKTKKEKLLNEKIDVTAYLVWFVEHYPVSLQSVPSEYTI